MTIRYLFYFLKAGFIVFHKDSQLLLLVCGSGRLVRKLHLMIVFTTMFLIEERLTSIYVLESKLMKVQSTNKLARTKFCQLTTKSVWVFQ